MHSNIFTVRRGKVESDLNTAKKRKSMVMDRVKTGIVGLDELLNGGLPTVSQVFVCGGPGTGKSTLGLEYLYRGAKMGEKGLFFSLEEDPSSLAKMVDAVFPEWADFGRLVEDGKIAIVDAESHVHLDKAAAPGTGINAQYAFSQISGAIQRLVDEQRATRVVLDSSTIMKMFFGEGLEFRRTLFALLRSLRKRGCTTLVNAEVPSLERGAFSFESEHFAGDGIIMLYNLQHQEKRVSALEIVKMRRTAHSRMLTPLKITPGGINVYVGEKVY